MEIEPGAIVEVINGVRLSYARVGLQAVSISQWLYSGLVDVGLRAICVGTRQMHAAFSAQPNRTDRNDARGIAQTMHAELFKPVYVKTLASQHRRLLLTSRKFLQRKIYDIENDLCGSLKNFGLKVGQVRKIRFDPAFASGARLFSCCTRPVMATSFLA